MHHDNMFSVPFFSFDGELDTEYIKVHVIIKDKSILVRLHQMQEGGSLGTDFDLPFLHKEIY